MTKQLQKAFDEVRNLSPDLQNAIAAELIEEVHSYQNSQLTEEQHAEVIRRLSKPLKIAPRKDMDALLKKYKVT